MRTNPSHRPASPARALVAIAAFTLVLAGCGGGASGNADRLLLSGPNINVAVVIPAGWHQVIDSSNPNTPEMVSPISCMGSQEVACATGLARLATFTAPNARTAAQTVQQAVVTAPGVKLGSIINQGPGKVGHRDGYLLRFNFTNPGAKLVSEVAAVPTGSSSADAAGHHEFSIVLVWISDAPNAPKQDVIDQIVGSALFVGGQP